MANMPAQPADKFAVLLHGLHQNAWFMQPLARRLQLAGFDTYTHRYYSLKDDIATHSARLHQQLCATHDPKQPIYIIAHSLGGLVARHFITTYPIWQIAQVVTLGTPHLGSISADYAKRFTPLLIGQAYLGALDGGCPDLPDDISLGVIAGNRSFGIGSAFLLHHRQEAHKHHQAPDTRLDLSNDGTVYVYETRLPKARDHLILPVTHTSMLIDKNTHAQTLHFLTHGRFDRQA